MKTFSNESISFKKQLNAHLTFTKNHLNGKCSFSFKHFFNFCIILLVESLLKITAVWPSGKAVDCKSSIPSSNLGAAFVN